MKCTLSVPTKFSKIRLQIFSCQNRKSELSIDGLIIWFQTERWADFEGSLPVPPTPPLYDLTLKWFNFFPIDRISGLEKYVMFQHQVCLFSRNFLTLSVFHDLTKKQQFLVIFQAKQLILVENKQSQKILITMKSLDPENIFSSLMCCKSSKIDRLQ